MSSNPVVGSNIQFQFRKAQNLRKKNGEAPNAAVYAKFEVTENTGKVRKGKTGRTGVKKDHNPVWNENINMNMQRDNRTGPEDKVTFFVVDIPTSLLPLSANKVATSKAYTISELVELRSRGKGKDDDEGFSVPLECDWVSADQPSPSLWLRMRDLWTIDDRKKAVDQVDAQWKVQNQQTLKEQIERLRKELSVVSTDIAASAAVKSFVDLALGSLTLIVDAMEIPELHNNRSVVSLLVSQSDALRRIREGPNQSPDVLAPLYGQVSIRIISSFRSLSALSANGLKLEAPQAAFVGETAKETKWFDNFTGTALAEGSATVPKQGSSLELRANRRKELTASEPDLASKLNLAVAGAPASETDAQRIYPRPSKAISTATQLIASWALSRPSVESSRLLWLYGPQGSGKTQFASSVVDALSVLDILPTYISCSPRPSAGNGVSPEDDRVLQRLVGNVAFQLAAYAGENKALKEGVASATRGLPSLESGEITPEEAFKRLLLGPLNGAKVAPGEPGSEERKSQTTILPSTVIVIDGFETLSTSTPQDDLEKFLAVLVDSLDKLSSNVRILLLTREVEWVKKIVESHRLAASYRFAVDRGFGMLNGIGLGQVGGVDGETESDGGIEGTPMSSIFVQNRAVSTGDGGSVVSSRRSSIRWGVGTGREPERKGSCGSTKD
ncbi:hypothetical protein FA15DRAFT_667625 [Coprinopsis marcescibilis]|uniref:C2 domain-containing protein n=1 Tax=Coprinopsis marcescibilis TaxID=230819 RepID=A0A5C3L2B0_COPMA|nr:hypothetical protein FA15DRAFT_667625 [Coprinopsis marcescibilis]